MSLKRFLKPVSSSLVSFFLVLSLSILPGFAQSNLQLPVIEQPPLEIPKTQASTVPADAQSLNDPQELEYLIDAILEEELENSTTPGAVISVVKDGEIFFAKGYGYADIDQKTPVVADRTLFRVASLSKLFPVTAAMQLYGEGLINLDEDISPYLDFELDNPYPEPVTFAQVMTHTDGTTKRRIGLAARTEAELESLAEHLPDHLPPIIWPPGELYSYSSYSIALLGYLIERITNVPFIQYVDTHILQPLNMQHSTFLQPPPPSLANDLAVGYQKQGNEFQPVPYLYLNIYPAAGFQTTAIDMAHFMIAHLQLGRYEDQRILEPDVARLMQVTHFTHYPGLPGTSYGFREQFINNIRTIGHLGSLRGYSSSLTLLPDRNIGIFVASNSFSGVHGKIIGKFFDRYFPVLEQPTVEPPQGNLDLSQFTGYYRDVEFPRHTLAKISGVFEHIRVQENDDNTLTVQTPSLFFIGNVPKNRLVPVEVPLFQRADDDVFTAFGKRIDNQMFAYNPLYPKIGAYVRVPWYETFWVQVGIVGICALFFLSACIAWLIRPLVQRLQGKSFPSPYPIDWALRTAGTVGLLNLVFLIGFPLSLWIIGVWKLAYGVPTVVIALLCLPMLATALTGVLAAVAIATWTQKRWTLGRRLHYSVVTLAALAFIPFLTYWNLLGFQF